MFFRFAVAALLCTTSCGRAQGAAKPLPKTELGAEIDVFRETHVVVCREGERANDHSIDLKLLQDFGNAFRRI